MCLLVPGVAETSTKVSVANSAICTQVLIANVVIYILMAEKKTQSFPKPNQVAQLAVPLWGFSICTFGHIESNHAVLKCKTLPCWADELSQTKSSQASSCLTCHQTVFSNG